MVSWVIFIAILFIIDFYTIQSIKAITKKKFYFYFYWIVSVMTILFFIYNFSNRGQSRVLSQKLMLALGVMFLIYTPKLIAIFVLFFEDIVRGAKYINNLFSKKPKKPFFNGRRVFVSKIALGLASIPFASLLYGMTRGKYNYQVLEHTLYFDDLPKAFDGYKITHISDIHFGSLDNPEKVGYGINLINEQKSDIIVFTGDLVNNVAEEVNPWVSHFRKLEAKDGKFSVLGNHDYADYANWKTTEEKEKGFKAIKNCHPMIDFDLLLNDSKYIEKGSDKIAIVGVENWGKGRFNKAGDIDLASSKIVKEDFKILLSHDPSHWDKIIKDHNNNYQLTLSGHTHGMQFGIEIPGIKWSPVKYLYKHWAGIYKNMNRYINVNRGFGFLGFPGRVGIWPEISVITLRKGNKDTII